MRRVWWLLEVRKKIKTLFGNKFNRTNSTNPCPNFSWIFCGPCIKLYALCSPGWRWQWQYVVLGLEEWSQFPASPNHCAAWYACLAALGCLVWCYIVLSSTRLTSLILYFISSFPTGSLDSEAGIYACTYDMTGSRLITCEADKTIKMWKEDESATPETHPLNFRPPKDIRRF